MAKKDTRERIKAEALNLFSTKGFAGGSVRDIGKKVGVRESALYNYFSSKEALVNELINDAEKHSVGVELLTDELLEYLATPKIFLQKFVNVLLHYWDDDKQKKYLRLIFIEQFRNNKNVKVSVNMLIDEAIKIWEMIFTEMLKYKFIKKQNARVLAEEFVYPLFMLRLSFLTRDDVDWDLLKKKAETHVEFFWETIKR